MSNSPETPSCPESDEDLPVVEAAGGVVWRQERGRPLVLLVHRPRYDDWSLPKGKRDASDRDLRDCAVREVLEETGVSAVPTEEIGESTYRVTTKKGEPALKHVRYWLMRAAEEGEAFRPNKEVDAIRWVDPSVAPSVLSYARDRIVVEGAAERLADTGPSAGRRAPQLTHLALGVADLDTSIRFYEEFCAMVVVHRREEDGVRVCWLADSESSEARPGFVLVLAEGLARGEPIGPFAHVGFAVASRAEVDEVAARAGDRGILTLPPSDEGSIVGYICEVLDPDGNVIEFSHGQSLGRHAPLSGSMDPADA